MLNLKLSLAQTIDSLSAAPFFASEYSARHRIDSRCPLVPTIWPPPVQTPRNRSKGLAAKAAGFGAARTIAAARPNAFIGDPRNQDTKDILALAFRTLCQSI